MYKNNCLLSPTNYNCLSQIAPLAFIRFLFTKLRKIYLQDSRIECIKGL